MKSNFPASIILLLCATLAIQCSEEQEIVKRPVSKTVMTSAVDVEAVSSRIIQNESFTNESQEATITNVLKTKHDTAKN